MIRGTTPTHIFNIPLDASEVAAIRILYAQRDEVILVKELADCKIKGNTVTVSLTQNETFKFDCDYDVQVQVRVRTVGGDALASQIRMVSVDKCLDKEVSV